jgi:hypothetical protein
MAEGASLQADPVLDALTRIEQQQQEMLALARTFLRWTGCLPRTE